MIGNLNKKILLSLLLFPLLFSCGNIETDNETGRYQVIEKLIYNPTPCTYYLLDTTGDLTEIDLGR